MHLNSFISGACLISAASASYNVISAADDVCAVIRKTVHVTVTETVTPRGVESSPGVDGKPVTASGHPGYNAWVAADDGTSSGSAKPSYGYNIRESAPAAMSSARWGKPGYGHESGAWSVDPIVASTSKSWGYNEAGDNGYGYGGASNKASSYSAAPLISSSADEGAPAHSGKPGSTSSSKPTSKTSLGSQALPSTGSSSSGSFQSSHSDGVSPVSSSDKAVPTFASSSSSTASSSSGKAASSSSGTSSSSSTASSSSSTAASSSSGTSSSSSTASSSSGTVASSSSHISSSSSTASSTASSSSGSAASSSSRTSSSSASHTISSFTSHATSSTSSALSTSSASPPVCVKDLHLGCSFDADCCTNEADGTTCVESICVPLPICIGDGLGTCETDENCCNQLTGTTCVDNVCTVPPLCVNDEQPGCLLDENCCNSDTGTICLAGTCTVPITCVDTDGSFEDAPDTSVGIFGSTVGPWTVGGFALFARNGGITGFDTPFGTIFVNMRGFTGRTFSLTGSFTVTPGLSYTLQYSYAHVTQTGGNSCTLSATFAGLPVDSFDAGPGTFVGGTTWVPRVASFTPLVATDNLRFELNCANLSGQDVVQVLLDNVSLAVEGAACT